MELDQSCARAAMRVFGRKASSSAVELLLVVALVAILGWTTSSAAAGAQYVYDGGGRLVQVIAPDGSSARYSYDAAGNIIAIDRLSASSIAITSFSPVSGVTGASVTILGSGFSTTPSSNLVTLNGTSAVVGTSSVNSLTITVPASATSGRLVVTNSNGTVTSARDFVVGSGNDAPTITTFSPTVGTSGSSLTVNGTAFQAQSIYDRVSIGKTLGVVTSASPTVLGVTASAGTTTGKVKVQTPFGTAVSSQTFFVPPGSYAPTDVVATGQVTAGSPKSVTVGTAGKIAMYSFDGTAGQRMSVAISSSSFTNCASGELRLYSPDGIEIGSSSLCNAAVIEPVELIVSGTYSLVVVPYSTSSGALTFTLNNIVDVAGTITVDGSAVPLTTTTPAQNMKLTFSGAAGQRIALSLSGLSGLGTHFIKILNPDATTAFSGSVSSSSTTYFSDLVTLSQTGTFTIVLDPSGTGVGSATFTLKTVAPDATGTITVDGSAVQLTTTTPAQNMKLTFSGVAGQRVALSLSGLSGLGTHFIKILNPDATTAFSGSVSSSSTTYFSDLVTLSQTGTFTIVLDPSGTGVGSATFTLKTVAPDATGTITVDGSAVPLTTTTPAQNMKLTFSGAPGQRVALSLSGLSGLGTHFIKILNPDATTAFSGSVSSSSTTYFSDLVTLSLTGTFTIVLDPSGTGVGSATFTLKTVAPDATGTITVDGSAVSLTTTTPAQNMKLTFSGTAGQRVALSVSGLSALGSCTIKILNPDGTTVSSSASSSSYSSGAKTLSQTGTYTISLDPAGSGVGSATFTLVTPP